MTDTWLCRRRCPNPNPVTRQRCQRCGAKRPLDERFEGDPLTLLDQVVELVARRGGPTTLDHIFHQLRVLDEDLKRPLDAAIREDQRLTLVMIDGHTRVALR